MNVIFLDFDGVINNFSEWHEGEGMIDLEPKGNMSESNLEPFKQLIEKCIEHDIKIVISSAWNINGTEPCLQSLSTVIPREDLDKVFIGCTKYMSDEEAEYIRKKFNIPDEEFEGCTESYGKAHRGVEIFDFLTIGNVQDYLIVDDIEDFLASQRAKFIQTDDYVGLTFEHVDKIITALKPKGRIPPGGKYDIKNNSSCS